MRDRSSLIPADLDPSKVGSGRCTGSRAWEPECSGDDPGSEVLESWLGRSLCSADSLGRIVTRVDADTLRQGLHYVYDRLKRNKALPDLYGLGRGGARWT